MDKLAYRIYVTDVLRGLAGGECARYMDWIDQKLVDSRTGAEIAADVIQKAGLVVRQKDET